LSKFFDNERKQTKKKQTINLISLTVTKNRFCARGGGGGVVARDSFLQRNENERLQHDDDDDDDEEKDGFDAFVVGVDVRVRLCSSGAFEALVALGDDAGGLGARFDEAPSTLSAG
tara:strand:+ start:158 stop:505 length:348 start_codon:yes stop_codon:yes gene_type:complete